MGSKPLWVFSPLVSIPSTALPETWLSFSSRIREVFTFGGLSGNLKQGEFGQDRDVPKGGHKQDLFL